MFKLTMTRPIMPRRKLSQVPFPAVAKMRPRIAAGTVDGAMTEID
jgi:hypothetical protein